ncbi:hypothetical protein Acr_03g0014370 [Actinidia rufa]|uniref:Uncharacterized protein n=1 Tax=Actinidia rufa TaxID=165716 RepID=A0A7J0EDW8_9ERIC|nr:hypothetical protein Acr_03g0014370 [Actinidia rufa]
MKNGATIIPPQYYFFPINFFFEQIKNLLPPTCSSRVEGRLSQMVACRKQICLFFQNHLRNFAFPEPGSLMKHGVASGIPTPQIFVRQQATFKELFQGIRVSVQGQEMENCVALCI